MATAWVFPGQGSQAVGMGRDLQGLADLKAAEAILGWSLADLTEVELKQTRYTQPALYIVSALLASQFSEQPAAVAGHSLGEYSALYVAGVFDFLTGVRLVQQRALLMDAVSGGAMTAVIGFEREQLVALCAATEGVSIANDNSSEQVVITGVPEAIAIVVEQLKPKRAVPLAVSGAFHSPYMVEPAQEYSRILAETAFNAAKMPVYSNVTARASQDAATLKANLQAQITGPVRWRETLLAMEASGITEIWEIGPGNVLTGLAKRTVAAIERRTISSLPRDSSA